MAKEKANKDNQSEVDRQVMAQPIVSEMKEAYLDYAMSVITARALPDVRDGLKPVHRRILYAMHNMNLTAGAKPKKSAAVVGEVLGKYHPHGDVAVYDALVKMAQDFTFRYPLVIGQGNFGSIDGDNAAAMRYTEAKMSKISSELLNDINKETVDFRDNYDGSTEEPIVLPASLPNLLLNGTLGIAVGMATNIPPHNLGELVEAILYLIDDPEATTEDLMQYIDGPDFPTGGIIFNKKKIIEAYSNGRGSIVTRGEAEIVEGDRGKHSIIIKSIPYRLNKSRLIVKIAKHVKDKKIEGVSDIRDESTSDIRIVVELKQGAYPQKVLNSLYKYTRLETKFHLNMVALMDGVPQTLSLKSVLEAFVDHRHEVVRRRAEYDLAQAEAREHILLGLKKALDHIDEIIALIKKSQTRESAHNNLKKEFKFSDAQAQAILQMQLQRLAGLERKKIEDELADIQALIKELKELLSSDENILAKVKEELIETAEKYSDERKSTLVEHGVKNISAEDLIPNEETVLVYTAGGYVKRTSPSAYKKQRRGGIGVIDINTKDDDHVANILWATTHNDVLFYTDQGKVYKIKLYNIPEGKRATRGKPLVNYLQIEGGERVTSILPMPKELKESDDLTVIMVTKEGTVKRVDAASFHDVRQSGIIAINLSDDDVLISTQFARDDDQIILVTKQGRSIRFQASDVRSMGRTAAGVKGIGLDKDDEVVSMQVIKKGVENPELFVISTNGYGKKTPLEEYSTQNRGGKGVKTFKQGKKTGHLVAARLVHEEKSEVIAMSKNSQVIRIDIDEVPSQSRNTQGVRIMKLRDKDQVASLVSV